MALAAPTAAAGMNISPVLRIAFAALAGASMRLIFYPQLIVGVALFATGVAIKLLSNTTGLIILFTVVVAVGVLACVMAVVFDFKPLMHALPGSVVALALRAAPRVMAQLQRFPLWTLVILAFGLPALGQLSGQFALVRTLTVTGATSSWATAIVFSLMSFVITILVNLFHAITPTWLRPNKMSFLLQ